MPSITVKNIPDELYELLKQSARDSHRSLNSEIIACIERAVRSQRLDPDQFLVTARRLREKTAEYRISDDDLTQAKGSGRL
jgi:plasmid stability protein